MALSSSFRTGLREGLVIFIAVGAFGTAFGALAVEAGLDAWLAVLASLIVVSGAAQFAMVGLLAGGPAPILIATTGLALRHVPMSVRLAQLVGPRPPMVRAALAWVLVDETFGMTVDASRRDVPDLVAYKAAADLLLYSGWVLGTIGGTIFGTSVDPDSWGASILFPLVFLGLAAPLVRNWRHWLVALLAIGAALASVELLPEAWRITGAAAAAAGLGAMLRE